MPNKRPALFMPLALWFVVLAACSKHEPRPESPPQAGRQTEQQAKEPLDKEESVAQEQPKFTNRLAKEKSPYLLQHAHNPVDWWPWSEAAFAEAKRRQVPIFLSIGYSTCHWCHVMEHESFENQKIAAFLNLHFVCIKIDREERPDIDAVYMKALHASGQRGGWPASHFLTPDKDVFYSGTYFRPERFQKLLDQVTKIWAEDPAQLIEGGKKMREHLAESTKGALAESIPALALRAKAAKSLVERFDAKSGGFGQAPKFPRTSAYEFLIAEASQSSALDAQAMHHAFSFSLKAIVDGGIYDHVGGGIHRYSTDNNWLVPHFEKMLYDQALVAATLLEAGLKTSNKEFFAVAEDILRCVLRDFRHEQGAFYSAYDADSGGVEGSYYIWTEAELKTLLSADANQLVHERFAISAHGNFHEIKQANIFAARQSWNSVAEKMGKTEAQVMALWEETRELLLKERNTRVKPGLDNKILTGWNGLMIGAFAKAARILRQPRYNQIAIKASEFIWRELRDPKTGLLIRRYAGGEAAVDATLQDYSYLSAAFVELFESTGDPLWLTRAQDLIQVCERDYKAENGGYFDAPADRADLFVRIRDAYDGAMPATNNVLANTLLKLNAITSNKQFASAAEGILKAFSTQLNEAPSGYPVLLKALSAAHDGYNEIVLVGQPGSDSWQELTAVLSQHYVPNAIRVAVSDEQAKVLGKTCPLFAERGSEGGKAMVYICQKGVCLLPISNAKTLAKELRLLLSSQVKK